MNDTAPESGGPVAAAVLADLAAASRILAAQGVVDGFGHVSMRHPGAPGRYLMSRSVAPARVVPADIIEYDLDSNPVDARGRGSFLERYIHGAIYRARPDVHAVVHSHSPAVIPFGLVADRPMRAMFHNGAFVAAGVPTFDIRRRFGATDLLVSDPARAQALIEAMAGHDLVLMRGHGSVVCGPSLPGAVFRAVYCEVNARIQHQTLALAGGGPIAALDEEEGRIADQINLTAGMRAWDLWREQCRDQTGW
jgi:HCOMODA/2-hydroxy-3-carboxy-muconic semialdehyde decarboxylase